MKNTQQPSGMPIHRYRSYSDAFPTDLPDRIDDDAIQRAYDFSAELIERLDQSIGPDLERPPEQSLLNEDED